MAEELDAKVVHNALCEEREAATVEAEADRVRHGGECEKRERLAKARVWAAAWTRYGRVEQVAEDGWHRYAACSAESERQCCEATKSAVLCRE